MMEEVQELIKETSKLAQAEPNQIVNLSSEFFSLSVINVLLGMFLLGANDSALMMLHLETFCISLICF